MTVTPPSHFHERAKRQCETGVFINLTSPLYPRSLLSRSVRDGVLHKPDQNVEDAMWTQLFINLPAFLHYRNKDNGSLFFFKDHSIRPARVVLKEGLSLVMGSSPWKHEGKGFRHSSLYIRCTPWVENYLHIHLKTSNSFNIRATAIKFHDFIDISFLCVLARNQICWWNNNLKNCQKVNTVKAFLWLSQSCVNFHQQSTPLQSQSHGRIFTQCAHGVKVPH